MKVKRKVVEYDLFIVLKFLEGCCWVYLFCLIWINGVEYGDIVLFK